VEFKILIASEFYKRRKKGGAANPLSARTVLSLRGKWVEDCDFGRRRGFHIESFVVIYSAVGTKLSTADGTVGRNLDGLKTFPWG
jgi:hypothetical protein